MKVSLPRFEHVDDALGLGSRTPRISWRTQAPEGWTQHGWQLECTRDGDVVVASGSDAEQVLVAWPFEPLESRERVQVRVRVRGADGAWSPWSDAAEAETGLLEPTDWVAAPVGASWPEAPDTERRPALVRRTFTVDRPIARARLYVTAHGLYEAEINGARVGDHEFSPGWTKYDERLVYWTFDVTGHLTEGENTLGAWLGDGWYRGRLGFNGGYRDLYGTDQALIAQLEITHDDGSRTTVATDADWSAAPSPILVSGLYDGEKHDVRAEQPGWSTPGAEAEGWTPVRVGHRDPRTLVAPSCRRCGARRSSRR
ncbi:alpha-L-rhamnosidase N-terminal domain-containing protein [Microbacterium sp. Se63.02b]|uniref:alpha-L-rhamnosidase N-terminal domain-containing protein n=1 Tax=Microbacterium sp. Se63.02b TaxID=2709304 RepID=UPI001FCECA3B|nr:alpha-L-rhamnosidase N-terminal domain-containing protein [Microbacterium sp. Se63.02b]